MRLRLWAAFVFAAVLISPGSAAAALVHVACPGSIQAAINGLDLVGPHTVMVTGSCVENLNVSNRNNLTIVGWGGPAAIASALPNAPVLAIAGSRNIPLQGLRLSGGAGIIVNRGSTVEVRDVHVEHSAGSGISVNQESLLLLGGGNAPQPVELRGNGGPGLVGDASTLVLRGFVTVENNNGTGIVLNGGRLQMIGNVADNIVRNNGGGMNLSGTSATFSGQNLIQNNGDVGIQVAGGAFATFGAAAAGSRVTIIEGHALMGLHVAAAASASLAGPHKIRQNGTAGLAPLVQMHGGINVGTTSRVQLDGGVEITDNLGPGITSRFNGALAINNAVVTNNSGPGVLVIRASVASVQGGTINGNGGANLACDTTSLVFGDVSGITGIDCHRIEREHGPPRPGAIVTGPPSL